MTKFELEQLFHMRKEIENLQDRINKKEKTDPIVSDVVQNGYKRHAVVTGVDITRIITIQTLQDKYANRIEQLKLQVQETENYINNIPFAEIRSIFRFRYIDNLNWIQIAHKMNDLYKNKDKNKYTENSVRHKHDRFLEKS